MSPISTKDRRTQQQRRDATKEKISNSTFELLRNGGYANLRTAAVAKAAGVSQGGLVHHFPNKDMLVMSAVEYDTARAEQRTLANLASFRKGSDVFKAIIKDSKEYYFGESFNVMLDVMDWGSRDREMLDEIRQRVWAYRTETERAWAEKLIDQGWSPKDAADAVEMTVCMVRGFAIRKKASSESDKQIERQLRHWSEIARNLKK